jgi:hypothetical protein
MSAQRIAAAYFFVIAFFVASCAHARAEDTGKSQPPAAAQGTAPAAVPSEVALNILVRRTLMTVNDANMSGNYTVLRDLAAPGFQAKNDPKKLADLFAKFRARNLDLAPILYFAPRLVRKPELTEAGALRLTGYVPTSPQQILFDMAFVSVAGVWRLDAIALNAVPAQAAAAPASADADTKKDADSSTAKKK